MPKKARPPLSTDESRAEFERLGKEAAIERYAEKIKAQAAEANAAYDDDPEDNAKGWNALSEAELKSDWENLRRYAKTHFPEGVRHTSLTPNNKLFAVAYGLGWAIDKIAKASGMNRRTLYDWVKRPDIKLFIEEFQMKEGRKDILDKFSDLEFKATLFLDEILSDKREDPSVARLKMDATKFVFERTRGKAAQPIEHRGDMLKDLYQQLSRAESYIPDEETEAELFKIVK